MNPQLSIVIATKNEDANIGRCLESTRANSIINVEVIVVDNGSVDITRDIAQRFTEHVFNIHDELEHKAVANMRGAQLNFGVDKARSDFIFFPDADMSFDASLFENALQLLKRYDALYVPEMIVGDSMFHKVKNFERSFYNQTPIDAVRFVRKELYTLLGGFDEKNIDFGFDDWDFTQRLLTHTSNISICTAMLYHHENNVGLLRYVEKKRQYLRAAEHYIDKWGKNNRFVKRQFGLFYRLFCVFVEDGKWKRLIVKPHYYFMILFYKCVLGIVGVVFFFKAACNKKS
jgi:glycosyltransferase involved in cell wall biosynthesis